MGKVQRITDFGAFVEIMAGTDGLLHVSEIANHRVKDVRDELKEGQQIMVKVINIDPTGKIRLSRKALLQEEARQPGGARRKGVNGAYRLRLVYYGVWARSLPNRFGQGPQGPITMTRLQRSIGFLLSTAAARLCRCTRPCRWPRHRSRRPIAASSPSPPAITASPLTGSRSRRTTSSS